ncbi:MAG TPA: hypothetical protein VFG43_07780 [Geminicoccaceae bacterium]|nr:hypothetical protein [Geminicoccaceae bacterium]
MRRTSALQQARLLGSFALGLPGYLTRLVDAATAREHLRAGLAARSERFLATIDRGVFSTGDSPYRHLLRHAGITERDVRALVAEQGLEATLERLYDAGVHVRLDEFKGRTPIRRGSLTLAVGSHDFDNPLARHHLSMSSGGSRSSGTRIRLDLEHYRQDALYDALFNDAFELAARPYAIWRPVPPWGAGLKGALSHAKLGLRVERWFSQRPVGFGPAHWPHGAATGYIVAMSRLTGGAIPPPEHVPLEQAATVARWAAGHVAAGRPPLVNTNAASSVRVCLAAGEAGLDIAGTLFRVGGEPLTAGKVAAVARAGARVVCHYTMSETGRIGVACARGVAVDDVHVLLDKLAMIRRAPRGGGATGILANVYTTLSPAVPKLMLNVESDDYGVVERRHCGCPLDGAGLDVHMHTIRSWEKLTSEGMTLGGADLIRLVEELLPGRFGGAPGDWQLVEEEERGLPRIRIVASPRLGPLDAGEVVGTALAALDAPSGGAYGMGERWGAAGTLSLERREPYATGASKILALHVVRAGAGAGPAAAPRHAE